MKKAALILLSLAITLAAGWWRTYDCCAGHCVRSTEDGGYIISCDPGRGFMGLVKTDANGDTTWFRTYHSYAYWWMERSSYVQPLQDGCYIVTGSLNNHLWLAKVGPLGDTIWTSNYGNDACGTWVEQTLDGGYIITGWLEDNAFNELGHHHAYLWLLKTDSIGDTLWSLTYNYAENWGGAAGYCAQRTDDGGYIVVGTQGWVVDEPGNWHWDQCMLLLKADSLGEIEWEKEYWNIFEGRYIISIEEGYIITGTDDTHIFLIKTDLQGNQLWKKSYTPGGDRGYCVQSCTDGGFIVTGMTWDGKGEWTTDIFLLKTDQNGDSLWMRMWGDVGVDIGYHVEQTNDGGYIITGVVQLEGDINDPRIWLCKTDSLGLLAVEEPVTQPETQLGFEVVTAVGEYVLLSSHSEERSQLGIFDASGRLVDELLLDGPETITWGDGYNAGVYFIVSQTGNQPTQKVILVR